MRLPIELALIVLLVATAVVIARSRHLFAAAMLTGIFSLLSAGLFNLMDAVDVAFTEAAVGAGITTLLFLGTLSLTAHEESQQGLRIRPLLVVLVTGGALIYGTLEMPPYGDPEAPIHHHVAPEYIEGAEELHIPNAVTVVLASYRGYDTLGETVVVFTAAVGVMMLLGWPRRRMVTGCSGEGRLEGEPFMSDETAPVVAPGSRRALHEKLVLSVVARLMVPFILLFALYVQFHGDFGPGGGFQAGVIFAAGLILYGLVFGGRELREVVPAGLAEVLIAIGVLIYGGVGVMTLLLGERFLDYDAFDLHHGDAHQGQHWGITAVEIGVGIAVAATMLRIYYAFASLSRDE